MINIIPMAGLGSRFSKDGYLLPKPLIEVSNAPMIVQVIRSLPEADGWIFIVRQEHIDDYSVDAVIRRELPDAKIIPLNETTEGQATTCMLAIEELSEDEEVFIAACDNSFLYDQSAFDKLRKDNSIDAIIWTFTEDKLLTDNPTAWGWLKVAEDGQTVEDVSVKVPVSDDPYHDHAVVASFYFKRAGDFKAAYQAMYAVDHRINGEFYVDAMPTFLKQLGRRSVIFDVDLYVGWGKPSDLYEYQRLEFMNRYHPSDLDKRWREFFSRLS